MNAHRNRILARQQTPELQHAGERTRLAREVRVMGRRLRHRNLITRLGARLARVLGSLIVPVMLTVLALSVPAAMADPLGQINEFSAGLNPDSSPGTSEPGSIAGGGAWQPATRSNRRHHPCTRRATLTVRFTLSTSATVTLALERAFPGRLTRSGGTVRTRSDRRHRRCTRPVVLPGTIVLGGVAGVNSFTLPGAIGGHTLEPGSYRLLATPALDGRAGNQQQTSFQITR